MPAHRVPLPERLRRHYRVDPSTGCWVWTGRVRTLGYGVMRIEGRDTAAHRVSYEIHVGPIPAGLFICHRCDRPPCVNPAHLFAGTPKDNHHDMMTKGRWRNSSDPDRAGGVSHTLLTQTAAIAGERPGVSSAEVARILNINPRTAHRYLYKYLGASK